MVHRRTSRFSSFDVKDEGQVVKLNSFERILPILRLDEFPRKLDELTAFQIWFRVAVIGCFAGALAAILLKQDINYDQGNYHYYAGFAFLYGRNFVDAVPGSIVSYLNPVAYVPFYLLANLLPPWAAGAVLGGFHGLGAALAIATCWLAAGAYKEQRLLLTIAGSAISLASPMALSEIGTSFTDISTAIFILCSVLLLGLYDQHRSFHTRNVLLLCGLIIGLATGLKLTNGAYALGLSAAVMVGEKGRFARAAWFGLGAVVGFLLSAGYWHYEVWANFGNPLYPFYNAIFKAEGFPAISIRDASFIPSNFLDAILLPWEWCFSGLHRGAEIQFRDIRYAVIIYLLLPLTLGSWIFSLLAARVASVRWSSFQKRLIIFSAVAIVILTVQFNVSRYVITIELLMGSIFISMLPSWFTGRAAVAAIAIVAVAGLATVNVGSWGRTKYQKDDWHSLQLPRDLRSDSILFLGDRLSYAVPYFSAGSRAFHLDPYFFPLDPKTNSPIVRRILAGLQEFPNYPVRLVLGSYPTKETRALLGEYGFEFVGNCWNVNNRVVQIAVCDLQRTLASGASVMTFKDGQRVGIESMQAILSGNWSWPGEVVWAMKPGGNFLTFKLDPSFQNRGVAITMGTVPLLTDAYPKSEISVVDSNLGEVTRLRFDLGTSVNQRTFCVPPSSELSRRLTFEFKELNARSPLQLGIDKADRKISFGLRSVSVKSLPDDRSCESEELNTGSGG
jgi:Glycosyltransferase family 87